jgi:hypothetical protein
VGGEPESPDAIDRCHGQGTFRIPSFEDRLRRGKNTEDEIDRDRETQRERETERETERERQRERQREREEKYDLKL